MKQLFLFALLFYTSVFLLNMAACNRKMGADGAEADSTAVSFSATPLGYPMNKIIREASGIADSKINPGYIWVEEDSGNPPQLYLLSHTASTVKKIYLKGATNTDWEDLALANDPDSSKKYLYIADIGDNDAVHASSTIYRLEEPAVGTDTVRLFDQIKFIYADGPRDAEAFLVDDNSKDIFIISKRDAKSGVYKLSYPYSLNSMNAAVFIQSLPYSGVVSAAASNDGKGIVIKTYSSVFYYARTTGETIPQSLQKGFTNLHYQREPQGEAIGFALDNNGFYTLSEKGRGTAQSLYFYKKK